MERAWRFAFSHTHHMCHHAPLCVFHLHSSRLQASSLPPSLPLCPNFNFSPPPKNIFDYSILALAKKQVLNKMTAASILGVEREGGRDQIFHISSYVVRVET